MSPEVVTVEQETNEGPRRNIERFLNWRAIHARVNGRIKTGIETFPPDHPARTQYNRYCAEQEDRHTVADSESIIIPRCVESLAEWV